MKAPRAQHQARMLLLQAVGAVSTECMAARSKVFVRTELGGMPAQRNGGKISKVFVQRTHWRQKQQSSEGAHHGRR